jgi:hypothetical protein
VSVRIVIAAAGGPGKWGDHLGVPKHLAPLTAHGGEPLLHRTIRQARAVTSDVHLTAPPDDTRYDLPGVTVHDRGPHAPSEYASTRDLWNPAGRTVLLLGDVYFTDQAMAVIAAHRPRQYRVFGRYRASRMTGTPYGEIFAASWWPEQHTAMDCFLSLVHRTRAAGRITRPPGWMLLRAWQRTPLGRHRVSPRFFTEIDDLTDDFDCPADHDRHPITRSLPRG